MPGVALDELWQIVKVVENTLLLVGMLVALSDMFSVAAVLLVIYVFYSDYLREVNRNWLVVSTPSTAL
jgi:hypothetical protein